MSAIVIDTSALLDAAARAAVVRLSAASRLELALLALRGEVMPFDQHQRHWALEGWRRTGKGRHPAGLNLGDCFRYGLARTLNAPLLFKGDDFAATVEPGPRLPPSRPWLIQPICLR